MAQNDETVYTLGAAMKLFEDSFDKEKGSEGEYVFTYFFGNADATEDDDFSPIEDADDEDTLKAEKLKSLSKRFQQELNGGKIRVFVKKGGDKSSA